jgi:D-serine deaminase-like pyridoxal phosphate-dependent protein
MERPIFKPIGTPIIDLDTPALVIDLDQLEHNLTTVHAFFRGCKTKLRPDVSAHGCPALAHKQIAAGGTVGGVAVATLGEAEVFAAHGIHDIVVTTPLVTRAKLQRLCALARQVTITVAVDHVTHIQRLAEVATANGGAAIQVAVAVDTGAQGFGVSPGPMMLDLIRALEGAAHLRFVGLITTAAPVAMAGPENVAPPASQTLQPLVDAYDQLTRSGLEVHLVSVGGVPAYESVAAVDGVTEVRLGRYALMDAGHASDEAHLQPAAHVLTTVTSRPEPGTAITDAGQKAVGIDLGLPVVRARPGLAAVGLSAEHCRLDWANDGPAAVDLGDRLWLTPWDMGTCINLYDAVYGARRGRLEVVWPIAARGQYR